MACIWFGMTRDKGSSMTVTVRMWMGREGRRSEGKKEREEGSEGRRAKAGGRKGQRGKEQGGSKEGGTHEREGRMDERGDGAGLR